MEIKIEFPGGLRVNAQFGQFVVQTDQPMRVEAGIGLSAPVRAAVHRAAAAVIEELAHLGVEVKPRSLPDEPDLWWERGL